MTAWQSVRLDEIDRRDGWIPMRDHLGIEAFGINAWTADEAGKDVIGEHTEATSGHEELYVVVRGHATFSLGDEEVDGPSGTLVFVADPNLKRRAVAKEAGTEILAVGATPGAPFRVQSWELGWETNRQAMALYNERRYAEAAEVLRRGIAEHPEHPGFHYNLACFESLAGEPVETVVARLERAIELSPSFRELAAGDGDFDPVRDTPEFGSAIAGQPNAVRDGA